MSLIHAQDSLPIALRAYAKTSSAKRNINWSNIGASQDWVLVFDTETNIDHAQTLRFGVYHVYFRNELEEKGIFYNPEIITNADELRILRDYTAENFFELRTREDFIEEIFFKIGYDLRALIVGLNLPFDLSRLAIGHGNARGSMFGGFSFKLSENPFRPNVLVKYLSRRASIIKFRGVGSPAGKSRRNKGEKQASSSGYFLDLSTIAAALTNQLFSLDRLAAYLETKHRKLDTDNHGAAITTEYLEYAVMDVQVTWECFVKLRERYDEHHLMQSQIYTIFSEAGLGKAYLKEMGVQPWKDVQPDFSPEIIGIIMSSYYGGRSEVNLRQTITQTAYCDFMSMYPTVCTNMGLWKWVIAQGVDWQDTPDTAKEAQEFLNCVTLDDIQKPDTWKKFGVLVQVQPDDDLFPVRAKYDALRDFANEDSSHDQYTIGLNNLKFGKSLWFTMMDCIIAKILGNKIPHVVRAMRFNPKPPQNNLQPINILGNPDYAVQPYTDDFYKRVIELRQNTKSRMKKATNSEYEVLNVKQSALKTLANGTSYGIFLQLNVDNLAKEKVITCYGYSGEGYPHKVASVEKPGQYYHPLIGTLITGAARLMLGVAQRLGRNAELDWIFCDTDSMAFAKPPDMTNKLFQEKVKAIRDWFAPLNPYDGKPEMFKLEDANFALKPDGRISNDLQPLYCLAVSAKRYALFNYDTENKPVIRKASAHGLGHFKPPYETREDRPDLPAPAFPLDKLVEKTGVNLWQHDVWYQAILNNSSGNGCANPASHPIFQTPTVRKYAGTTPELVNWFRLFNKGKPYKDQVKPFNFLLASKADRIKKPHIPLDDDDGQAKSKPSIYYPSVVAPFDKNPRRAVTKCFDRKTGKPVLPDELETYQTALARYHLHPEMKFAKGSEEETGFTERRHILATEIRNIGKEANRLEEQSELEAIPEAQIEYGITPQDEEQFYTRLKAGVKQYTRVALAFKASISARELQEIEKRAVIPHKDTRARLNRALVLLAKEVKDAEREVVAFCAWADAELEKTELKELSAKLETSPPNLRSMLNGRRKPSRKVMENYRAIIDV